MTNLAALYRRDKEAVGEAFERVMESGRYIGGQEVEDFEDRLSTHFHSNGAVGLNSGTDALVLGLRAMDIGPRMRVGLPALSFFSTAAAVVEIGATPVFVDTLPDRPLMDPVALQEMSCDAAILVHLFGARCPNPLDPIPTLSDAAQCAGWGHGRPFGEAAAISFYPTKTLGAAGDAGALVSNDSKLLEKARCLANHGHIPTKGHRFLGRNSRLDALQAALLKVYMERLDQRVTQRRLLASRYEEVLGEFALPRDPKDSVHQFVFCHPFRDRVAKTLANKGIETAIYYRRPLHQEPLFESMKACSTPNADRYTQECLAIPCHSELTESEVQHILQSLKESI